MQTVVSLTEDEASAIQNLEESGQFIGGLADRMGEWMLTYTAWWDQKNTYVLIFILPELSPAVYGALKSDAIRYRDARLSLNPRRHFDLGVMAKKISGGIEAQYKADSLWSIALARI